MNHYKLLVAYDGTDYHGWQWQPNKKTVAGQLEKAFFKAFKQKPISIVGASRTDSGVHAWGQVATVKMDFELDASTLKRAWQGCLPGDIMLRDVEQVSGEFPLFSGVEYKVYDYYISTRPVMPFLARYCISYPQAFDLSVLENNLNTFLGTHDFRSFCTGDEKENTVRTINALSVFYIKRYNIYRIRVQGPGFLRYMLRRIIGASLQVMTMQLKNKIIDGSEYLKDILAQKDPAQNLITAPARGLMLRKIQHGEL